MKLLLKISFVVIIFVFLFQDLDLEKVMLNLKNMSLLGIFLTIFIIIVSDIFYSYRWVILSRHKCKYIHSVESTIFSTILNMILPGKMGEISKVGYLKKTYNYTISNSLSLLALEKILDIFMLFICAILVSVSVNQINNLTTTILILLSIIVIFAVVAKSNLSLNLINLLPIRSLRVYSKRVLKTINQTISKKSLTYSIAISFAIWLTYYLTILFYFNYANSLNLSYYQILVVFLVSTIAFSIPLTPGSLGIYEASLVLSLGWFNVDKEVAIVAGLSFRLLHIFSLFFLSLFIFSQRYLNQN